MRSSGWGAKLAPDGFTSAAPSDPGPGLGQTLRTPEALAWAGLVTPDRLTALKRVAASYAVAVTPAVAALIDPSDPADPIARQFVPTISELDRAPDERADPIGDEAFSPVPGLVHRYPDRVLLKPLHTCPVYCRFCFRREMVGPGGKAATAAELAAAYDYIRSRPEIFEVIITGGDPLLLSPRRLRAIVLALSAIPHLGVIRLHSRVPVVDPARITPALVSALDTDKGLFVAIHANHEREFAADAVTAIRRLTKAGIALLGQTVLLRGVNDDPQTLAALLRRMATLRIKPYYLHHADLAPGTAQFRTSIAAGQSLVRGLRGHLSGVCQPTYVLDIPGGHGKVPIGPGFLEPAEAEGVWNVTDYRGMAHRYPPASAEPPEPHRPLAR